MHQMFVFHLQEWLLLRFFFYPLVPSSQWKGLGQQESMAQKTPRVSASQWQITVPSSKQRCLKEENHSVFSLLWKRTEKCCSGRSEADVGFSRLLSPCNALTSVKHCIVWNGWYVHQCQFTEGTELHRHTQHSQTHTWYSWCPHKHFKKEKSQMAELSPPAQFSHASTKNMRVKKR